MTIESLNVAWNDTETMIVNAGTAQLEYSKNAANQLILCARMNPWDRFLAMLEKKTAGDKWTELSTYLNSLDKQVAWKVKEKFARLSTIED